MIPNKYPLGITRNYFEVKFHAALMLGKESPWPWALPKSASFCLAPYSGKAHCLRLLPPHKTVQKS